MTRISTYGHELTVMLCIFLCSWYYLVLICKLNYKDYYVSEFYVKSLFAFLLFKIILVIIMRNMSSRYIGLTYFLITCNLLWLWLRNYHFNKDYVCSIYFFVVLFFLINARHFVHRITLMYVRPIQFDFSIIINKIYV